MTTTDFDTRTLSRLDQREIIHLVRVLRVFVNSLRMYPQDHPVLLEQADRLVGHLCDATRAYGAIWLDSRSYLFAVNEGTIDKDVPELKDSVDLAVWFRERGVQSLLIQGVLLADDVLDVFGWLSATSPDLCREALEAGRRPEVKGPLFVNPALEGSGRPLLAGASPEAGEISKRGGAPGAARVEEEDTLSGQTRYTAHQEAISPALLALVAPRFTGPFGAEGLLASLMANGDPVGVLVEDLAQKHAHQDPVNLYAAVEARAVEELLSLRAPELAEFLGRAWREQSGAAGLRTGVLQALEGRTLLTLEVLGKVGNAVYGGTTGEGSGPSIEVLETHVPWLLESGQRREALRGVQILARLVDDEQRTRSLRQRADIGLRRICRTPVVRSLLQQLRAMPGGDPETEELLYLLGSRSVARTLEELRDAQDKDLRLDLVDALTVIGRMAQAHGDDPDEVLAPLDRVLEPGGRHPWYLVRNVVLVLGNVGTPRMRQRLEVRLGEEEEPRVLTEIALGLMTSASPETLAVLGKTLLGGRLASAEAFDRLLPALLQHDPKGTFRGLENVLHGGTLGPEAVGVAFTTLVQVLGERAEPFLRRVFSARPLFRRRLIFSLENRTAALEALGEARGLWADALLQLAEMDPSEAIRDRARDLRQEDSPTGLFPAVKDERGD